MEVEDLYSSNIKEVLLPIDISQDKQFSNNDLNKFDIS